MLCVEEKDCTGCFRALSDSTRLRILKQVQEKPLNVADLTIATKVTQPTVSYHLKMLEDLGLVTKVKKGREVVYTFNGDYPCKGCGVFSAPIRLMEKA